MSVPSHTRDDSVYRIYRKMEPVRGGRVVSRQDLKYPPQVTPTPSRKLATVKSEKAKAAGGDMCEVVLERVERFSWLSVRKVNMSLLHSSSEASQHSATWLLSTTNVRSTPHFRMLI